MQILVVDDDDIARELLTGTLEQAGTLPDFSGDKLPRVSRQNSHGRGLAIVLTSSRPVAELHALAIAVGADGAVPKSEIRTRLELAVAHAVRCRSRPSVSP